MIPNLSIILINLLVINFLIVKILSTGSKSLNDLPWKLNTGDWIINATLTQDLSIVEKYSITEYVHSDVNSVRGKISISSMTGKGSVDVFYSSANSKQRIVIRDGQCELFTHVLDWTNRLFDLNSLYSVQNHVLLTGPSLLMRLDAKNLQWIQGPDDQVRGIQVHTANTNLENKLNLTYYYKKSLSQWDSSLLKAIRFKLHGTDPDKLTSAYKENFNLDIYSFTPAQNIDKIVTVTPGVGCVTYLTDSLIRQWDSLPRLMEANIHYIAKETVNGPVKSTTMMEVYVDSRSLVAQLKTTTQGIKSEAIYDYNLGLVYKSKTSGGGCLISPIGPHDFGIDNEGGFNAHQIFNVIDYGFKYIGRANFEGRPGFTVDVWETINYTYYVNGIQYSKVVTSLYFVPKSDAKLFNGYVLVGSEIKCYNTVKTGYNQRYKLIETIKREFYMLETEEAADEFTNRLHTGDCFPNSSERKTIALRFNCVGHQADCKIITRDEYELIGQKIKYLFNRNEISPARIANVDTHFDTNQFTAYVTFLQFPGIKVALQPKALFVDKSVLNGINLIRADSEDDCLRKQAASNSRFKTIVYCDRGGTRTCARTESQDTIKENQKNGTYCTVYYVTNEHLNRYFKELSLDKLVESFNRANLKLYVGVYRDYVIRQVTYEVKEVFEVDYGVNEETGAPYDILSTMKLPQDNLNVLMVTGASDFSSCYRACAKSESNLCETFSFCEYPDKVTCLTSNIIYPLINLSSIAVYDASCKTAKTNRLLDYLKIPSRRYKHTISVSSSLWIVDCASLCSSSDECFSFQQCGNTCTLGDHYTDSSSTQSDDCEIYIPKVSHRFKLTGKQIVSKVFHTELNLNLDQCASMCHGWIDGDEACKSYNFCPKTSIASKCSLTKYSVKDVSTEKTVSDACQNYELIGSDKSNMKQKTNPDKIITASGTSGSGAFGIIMLFLAIGLIAGLFTPFTIVRIKRNWISKGSSNHKSTFAWSRQINHDENDEDSVT